MKKKIYIYIMRINRGVTRIVLVFDNIVLKIPNFLHSWYNFIWGLCANIEESRCWRWNSGEYERGKSHLLCPVLWTSWGGWVVVMRRANVERHIEEIYDKGQLDSDPEEEVKNRYKEWIDAGFGGDDKCANYGYLNDRLVKIDYSS